MTGRKAEEKGVALKSERINRGENKRGLLNLEVEKKNEAKINLNKGRKNRLLLRLMRFGVLGNTFVLFNKMHNKNSA